MNDWAPIAITAGASLLAAFGAVFLSHLFEKRRVLAGRRASAYATFITSVNVLLVRVQLFKNDLTLRQSFAESYFALSPALVSFAVYLVRPLREKLGGLDGALRIGRLVSPPQTKLAVDYSRQAMIDTLEDVLRARTEIEIVGSPNARRLATETIDATLKFSEIVDFRPPWKRLTKGDIDVRASNVSKARDEFTRALSIGELD